MNASQYRAHLAEGIPAGNLTSANMITVAGVNGSGVRFKGRQAYDEGRAAYAVNMSLAQSATHPYKRKNNPYSKLLGKQYYQGLADGEDFDSVTAGAAFTPDYSAPPVAADAPINFGNQSQNYIVSSTPTIAPQPTAGSSSDWAGVLNSASTNSLFKGIGSGLATLIGGRSSVPSTLPLGITSGPSLGTMLLVGGAAVAGAFFLFRKRV